MKKNIYIQTILILIVKDKMKINKEYLMPVVLLILLIKVVTNLTRFQDLDQTQICMTFQISIKMLILNQMQVKIHSLDFKTQVHHFLNNYHLNVKVIILKTLYQSLIPSPHQLIGS